MKRSFQKGGPKSGTMDAPLIVVNFKTYSTAMANAAEELGQKMASVITDARMVAVASAFDLSSVSSIKGLEVWSQHLDPVGQGSHTGWLEPETAIARGATGTIINHAEHKVSIEHVSALMESLKRTKVLRMSESNWSKNVPASIRR